MENVAVIDLGTNTFHLLIVRLQAPGKFEVVYRERRYVYLGSQGIDSIGEESYSRGIRTIEDFASILKKYKVKQVKAVGTAALRSAENGVQFTQDVFDKSGINVTIISGDQEAIYIAKGINSIYAEAKPHLIMDIGGGSVEYIRCAEGIEWHTSLDIGISLLFDKFMKTDPISSQSLEEMLAYIGSELQPVAKALKSYPSYDLIGAAGTFEVLAHHQNGETSLALQQIDVLQVKALFEEAISMNLEQRKAIAGIPDHRAKYLIVALALIIKTVEIINLDSIFVSSYSLKEGVLLDF